MTKLIWIPCSVLLILGACTNTNEEETGMDQDNITQPIHYETEREQKERLNVRDQTIGERGGYPQSRQENVHDANFDDGFTDEYTTERTKEIANYLQNKQQIIQAQVAETDDRIVVAVLMQERTNRDVDVSASIEEEVRNILPGTNKEIVVLTNDKYLDRMRNLDARWKARETGEDLGEMLEDFFNVEND